MLPEQHIALMRKRARYLSEPDARYLVGRSPATPITSTARSSSRSSTRTRPDPERLDFVAAGNKSLEQYWKELEITSRVNRVLSDEAFRNIALGENYFRLLNLDYTAPADLPERGAGETASGRRVRTRQPLAPTTH